VREGRRGRDRQMKGWVVAYVSFFFYSVLSSFSVCVCVCHRFRGKSSKKKKSVRLGITARDEEKM
jgi:hypothetical protein